MSGLFFWILAACGLVSLVTGRLNAMGSALMDAGEGAVTLSLTLAGAYMLWCGLLKILERSGAVNALSRLLSRPVRALLGREGEDEAVRRAVCINFTANLLGLGNAATPAGLDAMQRMERYARHGRPSHGMCMFLLLNASSLQLIPTTVLSLRAAMGAADPGAILLPALAGSAASTACAVGLGLLCRRLFPA